MVANIFLADQLNFFIVFIFGQRPLFSYFAGPCNGPFRNTYLPYNSAHPHHCMKGLPYGQFLRIRRICGKTEDYEHHAALKAAQLNQHRYPKSLFIEAMHEAFSQNRADLLTNLSRKTPTPIEENIFLSTAYHKGSPDLQAESTWDLLGGSSTTCFIQDKTLNVGYRRPKSLKDLLVRAKLPKSQEPTDKASPRTTNCCTNPSCRYCKSLNTTGTIKSHTTSRSYSTREKADCTSNNLVYCISCKKCGKQYVG